MASLSDPRPTRPASRIRALALGIAVLAAIGFVLTRTERYRAWSLRRMSLEDLRAATSAGSTDPLTWAAYGERLIQAGKGEEAAAAYARVNVYLGEPHGKRQQEMLADAGYALARFGTQKDAEMIVERAARQAPYEPRAILASGIWSARANDFTGALKQFQRAVEQAPTLADAWSRLGTCYLALEQPRQAEPALRRAAHLTPADAGAHADLAECLAQQSRFREATDEYAAAVRLDPGSADYSTRFALASASAAVTDEEYTQAAALLAASDRSAPDDELVTLTLAGLHMRFGRMEEARRIYEAFVGRVPDHPDAWFNLSTVYTRLGDKDSAAIARAKFDQILKRQTDVIELTKKTLLHPNDPVWKSRLEKAKAAAGGRAP